MNDDSRQSEFASDEDLFERLREEVARPPFHRLLGPVVQGFDRESGEITVNLPFQDCFSFSESSEFYHGGVIAALIDLTGHAAIAIHVKQIVRTIDLRIDYLRPAPGIDLSARAKVIKLGRTVCRSDIDVWAGEKVVAIGRGTFITL